MLVKMSNHTNFALFAEEKVKIVSGIECFDKHAISTLVLELGLTYS